MHQLWEEHAVSCNLKHNTTERIQRLTGVFQYTGVTINHKTMAETDDTVDKMPNVLKPKKTQWKGKHRLQI
jgi:hypothetical protein